MENNLINLDVAKTLKISNDKAEQLNNLAVTIDNCLSLESLRTNNNKEIKAYKTQIEEAKKKYLESFTLIEEQALAAIKPFEEANKTFSNAILEAKKLRRNNELHNYYTDLLMMATSEAGEIPSWFPTFGKANEGISYNAALTTAKQLIKANIENCKKADHNIMLKCSGKALELIKNYAMGLGSEWEEL